jgi:hypothetical protein
MIAQPVRPAESQRIAEVRVVKTAVKGWRWDVTWQSAVEGRSPGVYDARWHVAGDFGYTRTQWGAWRAVRRAYRRRTP